MTIHCRIIFVITKIISVRKWERGGQNRKYCRNWEIQDCWQELSWRHLPLKNPDTVYTVDEEGQNAYGTSEDRVKVHTFTGWKATLLMVVVVAAIILFVVAILGLAFYLLPIIPRSRGSGSGCSGG